MGLSGVLLKDPMVKQVLDHTSSFGDLLQKFRADSDGLMRCLMIRSHGVGCEMKVQNLSSS